MTRGVICGDLFTPFVTCDTFVQMHTLDTPVGGNWINKFDFALKHEDKKCQGINCNRTLSMFAEALTAITGKA